MTVEEALPIFPFKSGREEIYNFSCDKLDAEKLLKIQNGTKMQFLFSKVNFDSFKFSEINWFQIFKPRQNLFKKRLMLITAEMPFFTVCTSWLINLRKLQTCAAKSQSRMSIAAGKPVLTAWLEPITHSRRFWITHPWLCRSAFRSAKHCQDWEIYRAVQRQWSSDGPNFPLRSHPVHGLWDLQKGTKH